jgi:hypothetical protein
MARLKGSSLLTGRLRDAYFSLPFGSTGAASFML